MFENQNANVIYEVLQTENFRLMKSNDLEKAKNILDAMVWLKDIVETETNQETKIEDSKLLKINQVYQAAFHFPNTDKPEDVKAEVEAEVEVKPEVEQKAEEQKKPKLPKTTRVEANKRKDWIYKTIQSYRGGISEQQLKSLYIASDEINHTEEELKKNQPNDREVRGCALCSRYIDSILAQGDIYLNDKNLLVSFLS
jgi:CHAT domain-containing protein